MLGLKISVLAETFAFGEGPSRLRTTSATLHTLMFDFALNRLLLFKHQNEKKRVKSLMPALFSYLLISHPTPLGLPSVWL